MSDGKVVYEVRADYDKLDSDLNSANSKIEKGTSKWGSLLKGVGVGIGSFVAQKAVEAAKAVWELGTAFEDGLAKVSTLVDTASVDMDQLGDSLLDLSAKYGLEASSLAESAYNAISSNNALGKDTEGLMKVLESSAKLAKAGFTDVDTAASATLKTLNAYGLGVESVDMVQKVLIQTQNTGITTVGELGAVLAQVTPSAAAVGISFQEVGAAIATMTAQGTPAAQATTQLNAVITAFLKPTKEMKSGLSGIAAEMIKNGQLVGENADLYVHYQNRIQEIAEEIGTLNFETKEGNDRYAELRKALQECHKEMDSVTGEMSLQILEVNGLQGALELLNKEFDGSANQMAAALGSSEALKASLSITGKNAETFTSNLAAMSTETDVVDEGFKKVNSTVSSKLNITVEKFKNILIKVFDAISPVISGVLEFASVGLDLVSTVLEPMLRILGKVADAWSNIANVITSKLKIVMDDIKPYFTSWGKGVGDIFDNAVATITSAFTELINFVKNVFVGNWRSAWQNVKSIFTSVFSGISSTISSLSSKISSLINKLKNAGKSTASASTSSSDSTASGATASFAVGTDYVPEDNLPALLHRGEAVLTAAEAKVWRAGGNTRAGQLSSATIGGASIDYDKLARSMSGLTVVMDGEAVGRLVEPSVSYQQARHMESYERSGFNG